MKSVISDILEEHTRIAATDWISNGISIVARAKYYLDVFANQSTISMKSVAEIYEVWCFLEIRTILLERLQF